MRQLALSLSHGSGTYLLSVGAVHLTLFLGLECDIPVELVGCILAIISGVAQGPASEVDFLLRSVLDGDKFGIFVKLLDGDVAISGVIGGHLDHIFLDDGRTLALHATAWKKRMINAICVPRIGTQKRGAAVLTCWGSVRRRQLAVRG